MPTEQPSAASTTTRLLAEAFDLRYGEAHRRGLIAAGCVADIVRGVAWRMMQDMPVHPSSAAVEKLEVACRELDARLATVGSVPAKQPARRRSIRNY